MVDENLCPTNSRWVSQVLNLALIRVRSQVRITTPHSFSVPHDLNPDLSVYRLYKKKLSNQKINVMVWISTLLLLPRIIHLNNNSSLSTAYSYRMYSQNIQSINTLTRYNYSMNEGNKNIIFFSLFVVALILFLFISPMCMLVETLNGN